MRMLFLLGAVLIAATPALAGQYIGDFEGPAYGPGPLNGQNGWSISSGTGTADIINFDNGPTLPGEQCVYLNNFTADEIRMEKLIGDLAEGHPLVTIQYDVRNYSNMSPLNTFRLRLYDSARGVAAIGSMHYDGGAGPASQAYASSTPDGLTGGWAPGGQGWQDQDWHTVIWKLNYATRDSISVTFDGVEHPQDGWWFYDWNSDGTGIAQMADLLRFRLFNDDANDEWGLDNIIITSVVPEPGMTAALGLGLLGLVPLVRRKK